MRIILAAIISISLSIVLAVGFHLHQSGEAQAQQRTTTQQVIAPQQLRTVPIDRGRLVQPGSRLTTRGGTLAITCCTNWNTSTGGTGCATFDTQSCPEGQFKVDCGPSGCW